MSSPTPADDPEQHLLWMLNIAGHTLAFALLRGVPRRPPLRMSRVRGGPVGLSDRHLGARPCARRSPRPGTTSAAAQAFFRSVKAATGITPDRVTTDDHDSYPRAICTELGKDGWYRVLKPSKARTASDYSGHCLARSALAHVGIHRSPPAIQRH